MQRLFLLATAICIAFNLSAQQCNYTFSGHVVDEEGRTLIGAVILIGEGNQGSTTDLKGNFRIDKVCGGEQQVTVRYLGYQDLKFIVIIDRDRHQDITLRQDVTELKTIEIEHHDASHTEYANNVVTLDEKKLEEQAGKTLGESLKSVSGVSAIQTGPGIFKPVIHGVHSNRILILNNGVRHEGQQWGAEHAPEIDPFIASNIAVIKDASAIKYGTDALGGVIIVNPPDIAENPTFGGTLQTVFQSNGRGGAASGMLEGGLFKNSGWGWRVQGTVKQQGDSHTPDYVLSNTGIKETNYSAALGYHREHRGIDFFFSHFATELGILKGTSISTLDDLANVMERDVPLNTGDFTYGIGAPRQSTVHNIFKVNNHLHTSMGEWRFQYAMQRNLRKEYDLRIESLINVPALDLTLTTHTVGVEWETLHSEKRTASFGVNGMFQDNVNNSGTQRIPFIPNYANVSAGAFGFVKAFFKKVVLSTGARYDLRSYNVKGFDFRNNPYERDLFFHSVSGTIGADWKISKTQTLDINLSSSWRAPHVAELFSLGTHQSAAAIEFGLLLNDSTNAVEEGTTHIKPEQAYKMMVTYERTFSKVSLQVSPFVNYISDFIFLRPEGVTRNIRGVYPYFRHHQTDAFFTGLDVMAAWRVAKFLQVRPAFSLLRATDVRNDDLLWSIPANSYEVALRYERESLTHITNFYIESKVRYVQKQNRALPVITPAEIVERYENEEALMLKEGSNFDFKEAPEGYGIMNVAAGFSINRDVVQYDFRIAGENLLNTKYREYTNRYRYFSDETGRNIVLSLKCIF